METITNRIEDIKLSYPIEKINAIDKILFIDIETTGFSAKCSNLYLIGCLNFSDGAWISTQFFADDYSDEKEMLEEFFSFADKYETLIHFNGNNFDLPYILDKCKEHSLSYSFDKFNGIDIFKRVQPLKNLLKLENCKQKTVEAFLHIDRDDTYSGGELITRYHSYVKDKNDEDKKFLLLHNFDDLKGMLKLLPVLSYSDLLEDKLKVTKVSANYYNDEAGNIKNELLMVFESNVTIPEPISARLDSCYITMSSHQGLIKVPLYDEELKYFYANYKDYYYLPSEDMAIHKSVASFVDKDYREKAKASNCYTRKTGLFLKQWELLFTPFFKTEYESPDLYFELTKERKTDREMFSKYVSHIIKLAAK